MRTIALLAALLTPLDRDWTAHPSVAVTDDAHSVLINPAGLGFRPDLDVWLQKGLATPHDLNFLLAGGHTGFAMTAWGDQQRYSFGFGIHPAPGLYLGTSYHYGRVPGSDYGSFDLGLLYRPLDQVSVGLVGRDINSPVLPGRRQPRSVVGGVAVRPFGERATLSFDTQWAEGLDPDPALGLSLLPFDGIGVRGQYALSGRWSFGADVFLPQVGLTSAQTPQGPNVGVRYTAARRASVMEPQGKFVAVLDLRGKLQEIRSTGLFAPEGVNTLADVLKQLERAKGDQDVHSVLLRLGGVQASWGILYEVREAVKAVREAGKPVHAYLYGGGNADLYVASAANKVLAHPIGDLDFKGIAFPLTYYKDLLDKLGVKADYVTIGEYKSAMENVTHRDITAANKEQMEALLDDLFGHLTAAIAEGRKLPLAKVQELVELGMLSPAAAQEAGLIDEVAYEDELPVKLGQAEMPKIKLALRENYRERWGEKPKVALIVASGPIVEGKSGRDMFSGDGVLGSDTLVRAIRQAAEAEEVKAVVVRIDSPGGSALGSDMIWRELSRLKAKKPVVISMGDVAASGGYWIATAGNQIVADPGTITGSIGVLTGKFSLEGLYDKLGIEHRVLKRGAHADLYGDHRSLTPDEVALLQGSIRDIYRQFLERVAESRKWSVEEADRLGRGRVYTGTRALKLGLVDKLGGQHVALQLAKQMAKLEEADVWVLPDGRPSIEEVIDGEVTLGISPPALARLVQHRVLVIMPEYLTGWDAK